MCPRRKIPIQIHFREEQGNILEILPLQSAALLSNLAGVTADVFIIQAQFSGVTAAPRIWQIWAI